MVVTDTTMLPDDDQLTVDEVNVGGPALRAAAFHLGKYCENENNEFMLCRQEENDARRCLGEGKAVTACALEFFRRVKKSCHDEFTQYATCIDKTSGNMAFSTCRKTQSVYDKCVLDNMNLERPPFGYFCQAKVHNTSRPKPPAEPKAVYPDATPGLPEDFERKPAKYGSRYIWMN